jgi:hypothetical protein
VIDRPQVAERSESDLAISGVEDDSDFQAAMAPNRKFQILRAKSARPCCILRRRSGSW